MSVRFLMNLSPSVKVVSSEQAVKFEEKRWWYAFILVNKENQIVGEVRWLTNVSPAMTYDGIYFPCTITGNIVERRTHVR